MFETVRRHLVADRWAPFAHTIDVFGADFTGATFKLQVRDRKDGGELRADLGTVETAETAGVFLAYAGTEAVADHITAGRLDADDAAELGFDAGDILPLSQVAILVAEATMEAMPDADDGLEAGEDALLVWDLHVTLPGVPKFVALAGAFIVAAGVTE